MARTLSREKIVRAALSLFHEFGYNGSSVQDITVAAGVPKGTFYNHFKTKELLALEVLRVYTDAICTTRLPDGPGSPRGRLRRHFEDLSDEYAKVKFKNGCLLGNFAAEVANKPKLRQAAQEYLDQWAASIALIIREAQDTNEISESFNADELARYLIDSFQGATLRTKLCRNRTPVGDFLRVTFDRLLSGNRSSHLRE
jgi:TetR/AcrR family transcriptional regulator, transcriptional repressor for nem operon